MNQIRKRLTYANVMSSLAVFLVVGGATAFAALGKNTVGTKQLKKNAVTTAKIKKGAVTGGKVKKQSLTGTQINLAKLGTVPSATNAAHATLADSIPPAEATHLVGAPGEPSFQAGSSNFGSTELFNLQPVGFYKDHEGIVHLQGLAKVGVTGPLAGVIFFLPPGYRPASKSILIFNVFCSGEAGSCETDEGGDEEGYNEMLIAGSNVSEPGITLDGAVISPPGTAVSLDGITFRAES